MNAFDCIVIGKGPAGISAAIYVATAGNKCLVIGEGGSALVKAESIANYYGVMPVSGKELFERGILQAKAVGASVIDAEVVAVSMTMDGFEVVSSVGRFSTKTVVLCCGVKREKVNVHGLDEFDGRGVSYCAVCDGFLYRGRPVAVIGGGAYAKEEAEHLAGIGCDVTVFTEGRASVDFGALKCNEEKVVAVRGQERVSAIATDAREYPASCVFVAVGKAGGADFARTIGLEQDGAYVKVDKDMMTNCPGIFAAGDVVGGFLQVATAAGEGALAGKSVNLYLKKLSK